MAKYNYSASNQLLTVVFDEKKLDWDASETNKKLIELELEKIIAQEQNISELRITMDMTAVEYVSSAFFRFLLILCQRIKKENLKVTNTKIFVYNLFKEIGLSSFIL
ncbi:MAG TPA: hypothetical protein DD381_01695 [Lentisphaeria bacterium]|nr:MAG: hypothetical protein A2X47_10335 [Lentisphaerae bacterium GWF2_38_69]HBM15055.1 hypothetical protein [Lentisphaeria bacterium]